MDIKIGRVDPTSAAELLALNSRNRHLRPAHVARLAGAMRRGEWRQNGDPVRVSRTGVLLDGQHRLTALVESGTTQELLVIRGLDDEAQETMDTGAKRRVSDILALRGEKDTHLLAAALNVLWRMRSNSMRLSTVPKDRPHSNCSRFSSESLRSAPSTVGPASSPST